MQLKVSNVPCYIVSRNMKFNLEEGVRTLGLQEYFTSPATGGLRIMARKFMNDTSMSNKGRVILNTLRGKYSHVRSCVFVDDEPENLRDVQVSLQGVGVHCQTIPVSRGVGLTQSDMRRIVGLCSGPAGGSFGGGSLAGFGSFGASTGPVRHTSSLGSSLAASTGPVTHTPSVGSSFAACMGPVTHTPSLASISTGPVSHTSSLVSMVESPGLGLSSSGFMASQMQFGQNNTVSVGTLARSASMSLSPLCDNQSYSNAARTRSSSVHATPWRGANSHTICVY